MSRGHSRRGEGCSHLNQQIFQHLCKQFVVNADTVKGIFFVPQSFHNSQGFEKLLGKSDCMTSVHCVVILLCWLLTERICQTCQQTKAQRKEKKVEGRRKIDIIRSRGQTLRSKNLTTPSTSYKITNNKFFWSSPCCMNEMIMTSEMRREGG